MAEQAFLRDLLEVEHNSARGRILLGRLAPDELKQFHANLHRLRFDLDFVLGLLASQRVAHAVKATSRLAAGDLDALARRTKQVRVLNAVIDAEAVPYPTLYWLCENATNASVRLRAAHSLTQRIRCGGFDPSLFSAGQDLDAALASIMVALEPETDDVTVRQIVEAHGPTAADIVVRHRPSLSVELQSWFVEHLKALSVLKMLWRRDLEPTVATAALDRLLTESPVMVTFDLVNRLGDWAVARFAQAVDVVPSSQLCQLLRDPRCPKALVDKVLATSPAQFSSRSLTAGREARERYAAAQLNVQVDDARFAAFVAELFDVDMCRKGAVNWDLLADRRVDPREVLDAVCRLDLVEPVIALVRNPRTDRELLHRILVEYASGRLCATTDFELLRGLVAAGPLALGYLFEILLGRTSLDGIATESWFTSGPVCTALSGAAVECLDEDVIGSLPLGGVGPNVVFSNRYLGRLRRQALLRVADRRLGNDQARIELFLGLAPSWTGTIGSLFDAIDALA
jgi:hypothetical protein